MKFVFVLTASLIFLGSFANAKATVVTKAGASTALTNPEDQTCQGTYQDLYKRGSISVRVVFGYKDTRPARFVGDRHERLAFVQRLVQPCKAHNEACGFVRNPDNADLFTKTITGPLGKPVAVELFVVNSSSGSDDLANRENPFQKWQSSYAQKAFYGGLEKSDIVFYNGHSRFGGGPDFEPPHLAKSGELDQKYYQTNKPGLQNTLKKLHAREEASKSDEESESDENGLKVLGLFSCASSQHFSAALSEETAVISSRALVYYADAIENSLSALSSILEMRCEKDFSRSLRGRDSVSSAQLEGFF